MSSSPTVRPSSDAGRGDRSPVGGRRSPVGSSRTRGAHGFTSRGDGLAAAGPLDPAADDGREQPGAAAGVHEQEPPSPNFGTVAPANASGRPSAMPPAPRTSSSPSSWRSAELVAQARLRPAALGEHAGVLGRPTTTTSKPSASFGCGTARRHAASERASDSGSRLSWSTMPRSAVARRTASPPTRPAPGRARRERLPRRARFVLGEAERVLAGVAERGPVDPAGPPPPTLRTTSCRRGRSWRWRGCPGPAR